MKNFHLVVVFGLVAMALVGCARKAPLPVLHLYSWLDYFSPELLATFEQTHGCRIEIDTFDSNETMYANIKGGRDGYDIIFPSSYQIGRMVQDNMLRPLDKELLPNVEQNFDVSFRKVVFDPKMTYSVPYAFSFTGVAYRKGEVGDIVIDSWACLDNPIFAECGSLLGDIRETIGAALKSLGYSLNTTDPEELQKAKEVVLRWKKNITRFDNERYPKDIASGKLRLAHGYNSDILQVMVDDEEHIAFMFPKEGFASSCDEMVIPVTANNVELAHAFINFLYIPENARQNMEYMCAPMPIRPGIAKLSERYRAFPALLPFPDVMARAEVIRDLGEANALYTKIWGEIMAAE